MREQLQMTDTVKRLVPWLVAVAFFMESLDTTILNTAVPTVASALNVAPLSMKAVLTSYTISLAVFIPISGWVADRYGTRRVFGSAIGIFTLGSFLCGISANIHLLVACRILQGCGGAMMVPVGRLTVVRTFAKSELIRAMSFVAIPGLIGPMLGPLAGGLIVGYLNWRVIFFVNIPIGLLGLYMVHRHLPDFRGEHTDPLDVVGFILFGAGIAILSYVLEVFGETSLSGMEGVGLLSISAALLFGYVLHARKEPKPLLHLSLFKLRTLQLRHCRRIPHATRRRRHALSPPTALSGRPWLHGRAIRPADHAAVDRRDEPEGDHAENPRAVRISPRAADQHRHARRAHRTLLDRRAANVARDDRRAGIRVRLFVVDAIHQHEYAGVRGRPRTGDQCREYDHEHESADVAQLRHRRRIAHHGALHSRPALQQRGADGSRNPSSVRAAGSNDRTLAAVFYMLKDTDGASVSQHGAPAEV